MSFTQKLGIVLLAYGLVSLGFMVFVALFGRRRPDMHDVFPDEPVPYTVTEVAEESLPDVLDKLRCCDEHRVAAQKLIADVLERRELEAAWRMPAAVRES